ncbi:hypothetical protein RND81_08G066100 [Saponaria officinalis]|uniref:XS domain-containing protein n=1 Tax=Saponaria officinalis TaxID=3572 RepID=A0AAW1J6I9_SAPOF
MSSKFAVPYCCVMVNVPSHIDHGKKVCKSYNAVRDCLINMGFKVTKQHPVWKNGQFTEKILLEFGMSNDHKESAIKLACLFKRQGHGIEHWLNHANSRNGPYLWVAKVDDGQSFVRPMDYNWVTNTEVETVESRIEGDCGQVYAAIVQAIAEIYPN